MPAPRSHIDLPRDPTGPALARKWLASRFGGLGAATLGDLQLAATELIANALQHGEGRIRLDARHAAAHIRLEVTDQGDAAPEVRREPPDHTGGWGLHIIAAVATAWGSHPGTTHVWCEIPVR